MKKVRNISGPEDLVELLTVSLEHEWAVSFEYLFHAYSLPKGKYLYPDPVLGLTTDVRYQTIQIGIDEMYHSLQIGLLLRQLDAPPSFRTDEVRRYPRILDNLKRDRHTEDEVTDLYQSARFLQDRYPEVLNMLLNIAGDEVRHGRQFQVMIDTLTARGAGEDMIARPDPGAENTDVVRLLHEITRRENALLHRCLFFVFLFSPHQDLGQRLFKNSIDHMRHWDKNSGLLLKLGSLIRIENAELQSDGSELSLKPMPDVQPEADRATALESLAAAEDELIDLYDQAAARAPSPEIRDQLAFHLSQNREHRFTLKWLLDNARRVKGLK
jgi:rubrerythrin